MSAFSLIRKCLDHTKKLLDEVESPNSLLWKLFIKELMETKLIILPDHETKLLTCHVNLSKASLSNYCPLIQLIKYGDFQIYVEMGLIKNEKHTQTATFRLQMIGVLQLNLSVVILSLSDKATNFTSGARDSHRIHIPALNVLLLSEVMDGNSTCDNLQSQIEITFMALALINERSPNDASFLISLGCLMMFASEHISQYLRKITVKRMIKNAQLVKNELLHFGQENNAFASINFRELCFKIKRWKSNVFETGKEFVHRFDTSEQWMISYYWILLGKYSEGSATAFYAFTISICRSTSMFSMTLSLRYLSRECVKNKQYVIALRLLNIACKYCKMYEQPITPKFVDEIYHRERAKIKKKLRRMKCSYCSRRRKGLRLKCCTACMKVAYCSIACQTKHWKAIHKEKCDRNWLGYYHKLKHEFIFDDAKSL